MLEKDFIKSLYNEFISQGKLDQKYAVVFVYNSVENADYMHRTECILPIEEQMIVNSFRMIAQYVYSFDSESSFIREICELKNKHKYVLVYSMAQNTNGVGRRTLIPLLCRHYNLINIASDEYASFLSGDKNLMQIILEHNSKLNFPKTIYINQIDSNSLKNEINSLSTGTYIVKPTDESASIGVERFDISYKTKKLFYDFLIGYCKKFPTFCIQEYIDGPEIEVPVLKIKKDFFVPGVCQIINDKDYLDYDTVGLDLYNFTNYPYQSKEIIESAIIVAKTLKFHCLSRIDFRVLNGTPYIIDIGANPTISTHSSTNYLFKSLLGSEYSIYHLLVLRALIEHELFKPSFNHSK